MSTDVAAGNEVGAQRSAAKRTPLLDPIDIGDTVSGRKRAATGISVAPISQIVLQTVKGIDAVVGIERPCCQLRIRGERRRSCLPTVGGAFVRRRSV
jgi:hypothetical protein